MKGQPRHGTPTELWRVTIVHEGPHRGRVSRALYWTKQGALNHGVPRDCQGKLSQPVERGNGWTVTTYLERATVSEFSASCEDVCEDACIGVCGV